MNCGFIPDLGTPTSVGIYYRGARHRDLSDRPDVIAFSRGKVTVGDCAIAVNGSPLPSRTSLLLIESDPLLE